MTAFVISFAVLLLGVVVSMLVDWLPKPSRVRAGWVAVGIASLLLLLAGLGLVTSKANDGIAAGPRAAQPSTPVPVSTRAAQEATKATSAPGSARADTEDSGTEELLTSEPPYRNRLAEKKTARLQSLKLEILRIDVGDGETSLTVRGINNGTLVVDLPEQFVSIIEAPRGVSHEQRGLDGGSFPGSLPPGGVPVEGTLDFDGELDGAAETIALNFGVVAPRGPSDMPQSWIVKNIRLNT